MILSYVFTYECWQSKHLRWDPIQGNGKQLRIYRKRVQNYESKNKRQNEKLFRYVDFMFRKFLKTWMALKSKSTKVNKSDKIRHFDSYLADLTRNISLFFIRHLLIVRDFSGRCWWWLTLIDSFIRTDFSSYIRNIQSDSVMCRQIYMLMHTIFGLFFADRMAENEILFILLACQSVLFFNPPPIS